MDKNKLILGSETNENLSFSGEILNSLDELNKEIDELKKKKEELDKINQENDILFNEVLVVLKNIDITVEVPQNYKQIINYLKLNNPELKDTLDQLQEESTPLRIHITGGENGISIDKIYTTTEHTTYLIQKTPQGTFEKKNLMNEETVPTDPKNLSIELQHIKSLIEEKKSQIQEDFSIKSTPNYHSHSMISREERIKRRKEERVKRRKEERNSTTPEKIIKRKLQKATSLLSL